MYGWETIEMAGDTVVLVLGGELVAIDSLTGETRWQTDYHLAQTEEENYVQPPALLQVNGELYLGQVDGSVEVLDLATGALVRQFALPPSLSEAHPVSLQMFSVPAGLLVAADTYVGSGSLTTLVVVNPADGSAVWERALDHSGRINVAPDGSVAVATYAWNSAPLVLRLLGRDGYSTSALVWLDANGETILETEPVRLTDMSPLVIASSPTYACITVQEFTCFDRAGTRYLPDADNVWDARFEGDVQILFTDAGVMRVDLP
jgi:outer membrane protein assembly factor BamB